MQQISLFQPRKLAFGQNCADHCAADFRRHGWKRAFVVTAPPTGELACHFGATLEREGIAVEIYDRIDREPTIAMFEAAVAQARAYRPDAIVGMGGGSPLDVAKLVSALLDARQSVAEVFGIDLLGGRSVSLACLPTTAGTGSEVSPNAILLDEKDRMKKGVVSPFLVPDATYVDPVLTVTVPPAVTAYTGLDALTHCLEAYTNRFSHPAIDLYALEGIRLIAGNLVRAVADGKDIEAREKMALGSLYGGICLGPVNTAAVHALAYPLGGEFHIAHGLSNAVLLPHVMAFNIPASPERYADAARALGVEPGGEAMETARAGVARIRALARDCGVTMNLDQLGVPFDAVPRLAAAAMKVTRLLKNNPRELAEDDARAIYECAFRV
jgi:alcohol dehydrogenase class IV